MWIGKSYSVLLATLERVTKLESTATAKIPYTTVSACMHLFGVVHWFASLLLLLPSDGLLVYSCRQKSAYSNGTASAETLE